MEPLYLGVILCFRDLIQDALSEQLEERIPFLTSSVKDFHSHGSSPHETSLVAELACAAGYSSRVDPALLTTLRQTPKVGFEVNTSRIKNKIYKLESLVRNL